MKQITIHIPDNKYSFFIELLKNFEYIEVQENNFELTDMQKSIIDQRLENYQNNPDSYLDWKDVQKDIKNRL